MEMSNTIQRRVILEELSKLKSHPNADELYEKVRIRLPKISLGTVYRNLELLAVAGQVYKLEICGREKRFDGNIKPHYHMRCTKCGAIEDIDVPGMEQLEMKLTAKLSGRIKSYNLEFSGICYSCENSGNDLDVASI